MNKAIKKTAISARPAHRKKHDLMLEVAATHFLSLGYAATSIEGIATKANVSKVTIYNHFSDKDCLFSEAIHYECRKLRERIALSDSKEELLEVRLSRIGMDIVAFISRPEMIQFEQRIAAETAQLPHLGAAFLDAGPIRLINELSEIFERMQKQGELSLADPKLAAEQFISMCKGIGDLKGRFGQQETNEMQAQRVAAAIEIFIRNYKDV